MDYFATTISFFTTAPTEVEGLLLPTDEERQTGTGTYCVVAWALAFTTKYLLYFIIWYVYSPPNIS